jgi:hypothetical protein
VDRDVLLSWYQIRDKLFGHNYERTSVGVAVSLLFSFGKKRSKEKLFCETKKKKSVNTKMRDG